jgi:hypothetical protein
MRHSQVCGPPQTQLHAHGEINVDLAITAFRPYVDAPRCTLIHAATCVDLQLRPATYVYAVTLEYIRLGSGYVA